MGLKGSIFGMVSLEMLTYVDYAQKGGLKL